MFSFTEFPIWPWSDQEQCFRFQSLVSSEWTVLPFSKMHRRSLLASEKKSAVSSATSAASIERTTPSRNNQAASSSNLSSRNSAAFITKSNKPNNKQEINKPKFAKGIRGGGGKQSRGKSSSPDPEILKSIGKFCHSKCIQCTVGLNRESSIYREKFLGCVFMLLL